MVLLLLALGEWLSNPSWLYLPPAIRGLLGWSVIAAFIAAMVQLVRGVRVIWSRLRLRGWRWVPDELTLSGLFIGSGLMGMLLGTLLSEFLLQESRIAGGWGGLGSALVPLAVCWIAFRATVGNFRKNVWVNFRQNIYFPEDKDGGVVASMSLGGLLRGRDSKNLMARQEESGIEFSDRATGKVGEQIKLIIGTAGPQIIDVGRAKSTYRHMEEKHPRPRERYLSTVEFVDIVIVLDDGFVVGLVGVDPVNFENLLEVVNGGLKTWLMGVRGDDMGVVLTVQSPIKEIEIRAGWIGIAFSPEDDFLKGAGLMER